jgi:hypothetical protein
MIDVNKAVREAIMTALADYDVYHEHNPDELKTEYILLTTQTETDNSNKARFVTKGTILIDIVHITDGVTYDSVDVTAGEVMEIMQPTTTTNGLINPSGLTILNVKKLSSTPLTLIAAGRNVMRRILRYEYTVCEN